VNRIPVAGCRNLSRIIVAFYCAQTVDKALLVVRAAEQKTQRERERERERERILGEIVYSVFIISAENLAVNL